MADLPTITIIDLWPVPREYFGRCYLCRWNQCDDCIGPPCECACEWPKRIVRVDRLLPIQGGPSG